MNDLPMILRKQLLVFICTVLVTHTILAQRYAHALIKSSPREIPTLVASGLALDHVHWHEKGVEGDFLITALEDLQRQGIRVDIIHEDAEAAYSKKLASKSHQRNTDPQCLAGLLDFPYEAPAHFKAGTYQGNYRYDEMLAELDRMAALYPHLISTRQAIGEHRTHEGRPIHWVRISDNPSQDEDEPEILYTALHHAKEPVSLTQLIYFMWYMLDNYDKDERLQQVIQNTELYFIPCVNPDGYVYNETVRPQGGGLWRKNRRANGDGTYGVDLNRNYGHKWGFDNEGSSGKTNSDVYRGPSAFSEPETQAVQDFTMVHNFKIALNYHSFGNFLIYPYGYTEKPTEDFDIFQELASLLTTENKFIHGTGLETLAYRTNGDADDWMYSGEGKNKIFSMTPEVGGQEHGFWPHAEDVEFLCKSALKQNLDAAYFLLNSGMLIDESERFVTDLTGSLPFRLTKLGFEEVGFTLKLQPLTGNIQFENASKFYILSLFSGLRESFPYILDSDIGDGERIQFSYTIDNGSYIHTDTVTKYFRASKFVYENEGTLDYTHSVGFQNNWAVNTSEFYSAPSSLTDSPNGNTFPYSDNSILTDAFFLEEVDSAVLTFRGKWDIQTGYDYLKIELAAEGQDFIPLCGKYSVAGILRQNLDDPVYTGRQHTWVNERIDLSSYIGQQVQLRFRMVSTNNSTRDGAYIDDIKVLQYNEGVTTHSNLIEEGDFETNIYPNPAAGMVSLESSNPAQHNLRDVRVYNHLGQEVLNLPYRPLLSFDITRWAQGLYYVVYHDQKGRKTSAKKLLVQK
ncbi:MAG: T9SS type A sorting domain-containing protein [Saprospiraceae bacterium]|nr:T9SS type A sorting domain-containing protein [Saprospiraceae bacterium]